MKDGAGVEMLVADVLSQMILPKEGLATDIGAARNEDRLVLR